MGNAVDRLHEARRPRQDPPLLSARVVSVDGLSGTATILYDGVEVEEVRYQSGFQPQPGDQVAVMMNGSEPFILSSTGPNHDPVFSGRVVANSFHAVRGDNLLGSLPWDGWDLPDEVTTEVSGDQLSITLPNSASPLVLYSPPVSIPMTGRYYTGFFQVLQDPQRNMEAAWCTVAAFDDTDTEVASWGTTTPAGRAPEGYRYPAPQAANMPPPSATTIQMKVTIPRSTAGTVILGPPALFTAPVMESGSLLLGGGSVDPGGANFPEVSVDGVPLGRSPRFRSFNGTPRSIAADTLLTIDTYGIPASNRGSFVTSVSGENGIRFGLIGLWDIDAVVVVSASGSVDCFVEVYNLDTGARYYGQQVVKPSSLDGILSVRAHPKILDLADRWAVRVRCGASATATLHSINASYGGPAI